MDITEQYIKMCDCPEIQDGWKPENGDYIANYISNWMNLDDDTKIRSKELKGTIILDVEYTSIKNRKLCILLPRQDQMQEKLPYDSLFTKVRRFKDFIFTIDVIHIAGSMEQLWLAFVMHELHHLKWSGSEWVKEK